MGRWSHYDTDEERLPDGMKRVGYDADTQVYTYRDTDGSFWEGAPGAEYGKLFRVRSHRDQAPPLPSITIPDDIDGDEPGPHILPDYEGDGIPKTGETAPPSIRNSIRTSTTSPTPSSASRVTNPGKVHLRRSHYPQRKSKRLPSLPGSEKDMLLSRTSTMSADDDHYHYDGHIHFDDKENTIPEAPELTPSHSHSNHSEEEDDILKLKTFPNFYPSQATESITTKAHIHRQRRAQEREKKQEKEHQSAFKRAGTISRIARYLSRSAGGSKKDNESMGGLRSGHSTAFSSTATGFSALKWKGWPGRGARISEEGSGNEEVKIEREEVEGIPRTNSGAHRRQASGEVRSAGGGPQMMKPKPRARAMTFDEILASDGRLRGVITA